MITIQNDYFDLAKIAASGQCFRWRRATPAGRSITLNEYNKHDSSRKGVTPAGRSTARSVTMCIPAFGRELTARQEGNTITLDCSDDDYNTYWRSYFDLDCDYALYHKAAAESGLPYLQKAAEFSKGIRILRQELWETLISFIISQNNNIPRICLCLDRVIARFGHFPAQDELNGGSLAGLGLGYREAYLYDAARVFTPDMRDFSAICGVGPKVNSCVRLFGLGIKEEFPRDVWIKRIETEHFDGRFPEERFQGFAGVMQQFLFYYGRSSRIPRPPC